MSDNTIRPGDMFVVVRTCPNCTCKELGTISTAKRIVTDVLYICKENIFTTDVIDIGTRDGRNRGFPLAWCKRIKPEGETGTTNEHWEKPVDHRTPTTV